MENNTQVFEVTNCIVAECLVKKDNNVTSIFQEMFDTEDYSIVLNWIKENIETGTEITFKEQVDEDGKETQFFMSSQEFYLKDLKFFDMSKASELVKILDDKQEYPYIKIFIRPGTYMRNNQRNTEES